MITNERFRVRSIKPALYAAGGFLLFALASTLETTQHPPDQGPSAAIQPSADVDASRPETVVPSAKHSQLPAGQSSQPMKFSIGRIDSRFGVSRGALLALMNEAKSLWEKEAGRELFQYDPVAKLSVNLIFDERQQNMFDAKRVRSSIRSSEQSFNELREEYEAARRSADRMQTLYNLRVTAYNEKMEELDSRIDQWNSEGGAPPEIVGRVHSEQAALRRERNRLSLDEAELQRAIARVNALVDELNELVRRDQMEVTYYNGHFVNSRPFDVGDYDGREINIYAFDGQAELKATLVHELGHALGIQHCDDPSAIMYPTLARQDLRRLHLASADKNLLRAKLGECAISER